jgi:hypothetical protein
MVPLVVFTLHIIAGAAAFTRRWQEDGTKEGVLAVVFFALIFFVGWSITGFLLKLVMPLEGLGPLLDRDAASLLLLTVGEAVFYYFFLKEDERNEGEADA